MKAVNRRRTWDRWLAKRIQPHNPTRLTQRRIYILPSAQGVAFAGVLLIMLLAAINYQNSLAYALTFLLASVVFISILHTYRNLVGLVLSASVTPAVFAGEQAVFRVRLDGAGRVRQAVTLGWQSLFSKAQTLDVANDALVTVDLGIDATSRGRLRPGRLRVESRFPLGLINAWSWVDLDQSLLVYPRPIAAELPLTSSDGSEKQAGDHSPVLTPGADDYQGLRPYQHGDSRRRLHWKAYSRGQGLLIKDFASAGGQELALDYDAIGGGTEARLSVLCHWVLELTARQQAFSLRLPGRYLNVDLGEHHRDACLNALALFGERT